MISRRIWGEKYKEYYKNRDSEIGAALTVDVITNSRKTAITLIEERRTRKQRKGKAREAEAMHKTKQKKKESRLKCKGKKLK